MAEFWYGLVIALYVIGFLITVAGVITGVFRTISAVTETWSQLLTVELQARARIENEVLDEFIRSRDDDSPYRSVQRDRQLVRGVARIANAGILARDQRVPSITAVVLRANAPTGLSLLVAGILTTAASIIALFPPA